MRPHIVKTSYGQVWTYADVVDTVWCQMSEHDLVQDCTYTEMLSTDLHE